MAYTEMERAANKILHSVNRGLETKIVHHKTATKLKECLVKLLVTGVCDNELKNYAEKTYGVKKPLKHLNNTMGKTNRLPLALYTKYSIGGSEYNIQKDWKINKRDWNYVHKVIKHVITETTNPDLKMMLLLTSVDQKEWELKSEYESKYEDIEVILDRRAMEDILLSVLEGYKVRLDGKNPYTEVYGLCLGMTRKNIEDLKGYSEHTKHRIFVMRSSPQIRAEMKKNECFPRDESYEVLMEVSNDIFPQYEIVGEYHSHPYDLLSDLMSAKGWEPSDADKKSMSHIVKTMKQGNHRMRISMIVAIAKGNKTEMKGRFKNKENVLKFHVGGCHIFISVYRVLSGGVIDEQGITLSCPAIYAY